MNELGHFVYLYRDKSGAPIYVGTGGSAARAEVHSGSGGHNERLTDYLKANNDWTLEIAGPFGNEEVARAAETVLISALKGTPSIEKGLFNISAGSHALRFRRLSVPVKFADRLNEPELERNDLLKLVAETSGPLLFVLVSNKNFRDERNRPFDPTNPPPDEKILERFAKWWQLENRLRGDWADNPHLSPRTLIGLFGPPGSRSIIGAVAIATDNDGRWRPLNEQELIKGGLVRVPVKMEAPSELDYLRLRGRRISTRIGLEFGRFRQAQFQIFPSQR